MIFSRPEYESEVELLPKEKLTSNKKLKKGKYILYLFSNTNFLPVTMYTCPIFEKITMFKLMAGPNSNSVVVVKFSNRHTKPKPYELIENISSEYINFQVRFVKTNKIYN